MVNVDNSSDKDGNPPPNNGSPGEVIRPFMYLTSNSHNNPIKQKLYPLTLRVTEAPRGHAIC